MSDKLRMGVEVNTHAETSLSTPKSNAPETQVDSPFCIAVMGDFSGGSNHSRNINNKDPLRLIEIDRDNFEDIIASFNITLSLKLSNNEQVDVQINELDDFHPDELYAKLESFSQLRSLHRRLKNNTSFAEAAAEIQSWLPENVAAKASPAQKTVTQGTTHTDTPTETLLDSILSSPQENSSSTESSQVDQLIRSIISPYVEPATDPRQDEMLKLVDNATQNHMREILHHADFQALESAWQSVYFLIKRLNSGAKLKLFLLNISKAELQHDMAIDDLSQSSVYKLFCDTSEGDLPWSVILGNYTFSDNINDVLSLANIGAIAQQANAPFISAANETLVGCESFDATADYEDWSYTISDGVSKAWQMLRQSAVAGHIALALPRFVLRLPYGKKSKPIDSFSFEEMTAENKHADYLWGNAAFIKVECLAQNFLSNGWQLQISEHFQTENLPTHYYQFEGETISKPIAEIMLTEKGGEIISHQGLIPLWSVRNMDCIRSADYFSIAENAQVISGRWKS